MSHKIVTDLSEEKTIEWVEVPYYPSGVRAGKPTEVWNDDVETILIPKIFATDPCYVVTVHGQSMRDYNLHEGDELIVRAQTTAENGQIVIAMVDGGNTVKAYYEDENGDKWLVPGNPEFSPILITGEEDVIIQGVVTRITQKAPSVSLRDCARITRTAQKQRPNRRAAEFPLLTDTAIREGRAERILSMLSHAAKGSAADLMDELHHQALLGNISYKNIKTTQLHEILVNYLEITYGYEIIRRERRDV